MPNDPQTSPTNPSTPAAVPTSPQPQAPGTATPAAQAPSPPQLWDRLPGESQEAFSLFTAYLNLGPRATVGKLLDALKQLPSQAERTSDSLYHFCTRFRWRERAAARRQFEAQLQFKPLENLLTETANLWSQRAQILREQQWENAQSLNDLGQDALEQVSNGQGAPSGATAIPRLFHAVARLGRQALEPPPAGLSISPEEQAARIDGEIALNRSYGPIAASGIIPNVQEQINRERTQPRSADLPATPDTPKTP